MDSSSRTISKMCVGSGSLVFEIFANAGQRIERLRWELLPVPMQPFFIHHFGDEFRTLCSPLRVNPSCQSTQILRDTSMVDCNIEVEQDEVLRRINEAAHDHARYIMRGMPPRDMVAHGSIDGPKRPQLR